MSLGRVVGPLWAGMVIDINSALPFLTGALVMLVGFIASLFLLQKQPVVNTTTLTEPLGQ
jgi:hypothetical protein